MAFSYELKEQQCVVYNLIASTESDCGVKANIVKNIASSVPLEYIKDAHVVEKLYTGRPEYPTDTVLLQVALPGHAFQTYEAEPNTLAITLNAYFRLLEFVRGDLKRVLAKIEHDSNLLVQKNECVYITSTICSDSIESMVYEFVLDAFGEDRLLFVLKRSAVTKEATIALKYSDEALGQLMLPLKAICKLSEDRSILMKLLRYNTYKDKQAKKRTR